MVMLPGGRLSRKIFLLLRDILRELLREKCIYAVFIGRFFILVLNIVMTEGILIK
jgi:hypothetical protein